MSPKPKQLSNPFSTGGGGGNFETRVQAGFVVLMLTGGFPPCLAIPIEKIKLQGKYAGYSTDDLIIFLKTRDGEKGRKLLGQIKHSVKFTERNTIFGEVLQAAWSDFKNPKIFTEGSDAIALMSGPLSATDLNDVQKILELARYSEDATDFLRQTNLVKFSSDSQRRKLKAFRIQLKNANGGKDVLDDELWRFMRSFHLLVYDLDSKAGVSLSFLQSLICQYSQENAQALWAQIVNEVQSANQNAGTITVDSLPEELQSSFQRRIVETIPAGYSRMSTFPVTVDWSQFQFASELAVSNLLGSWDEKSVGDQAVAGKLANAGFADWIHKIREILHQPESPVTLTNGRWAVSRRLEMWKILGPRLFNDHLDLFKQCVVDVLRERDPQFVLPPEERYAASIHGKVLTHSHTLRKGLAESLALLGSHPKALTNCSLEKPESIAVLAVREVFHDADWILWASVNDLLPLLAEAAPREFLDAVEAALQQTPSPFDELFSQEGSGITGRNYMTGLLWALEDLAWDEQYLGQGAVILGGLATRDPGGNWANRPANSLTTIFLPWLPQTTASVEKRKAAISALRMEVPEIAWKTLLGLLPNQHQISSGSHKPVWRGTIPEDWSKEVTPQEYWDQISYYADMAIQIAGTNILKLTDLIDNLENLPQPVFDKLLAQLESADLTAKHEKERLPLWTKLIAIVSKHKKFSDAKWAFRSDLVEKIDRVAEILAPKNPMNLYQPLFTDRESDLYGEKGNWEEQQKKLEERRQNAIRDIVASQGLESVIEFAESVESSSHVGFSLGFVAQEKADSVILPKLLKTENGNLAQFSSSFVWGRFHSRGWAWVDQIDKSGWSPLQKGQFLAYLPFTDETWKRSEQQLCGAESEYWKNASVNPYQPGIINLDFAIDKLIEHGRPRATIICLNKILHDKKPLNQSRTVKALLAAASSAEPARTMDVYHTVEIIKALQEDPNTNSDDLFRVEWAYLPLLERHRDASPKLLEQRLASDPNFYSEVVRLIYRSKNESKSDKEPTEQQRAIATNAYRLLREWRVPPGMQPDGSFSGDQFNKWLDSIKATCSKSGHLEVALSHVGNVLIHCPPDPSGLWIHHAAAAALNAKEADKMRNGFHLGIVNSRGVHWVDPTGKPEKELAAKYRQQASDVENLGYQRLAVTLRGLADSYDRDAERIIAEHNRT
jgi:hypothetical protein